MIIKKAFFYTRYGAKHKNQTGCICMDLDNNTSLTITLYTEGQIKKMGGVTYVPTLRSVKSSKVKFMLNSTEEHKIYDASVIEGQVVDTEDIVRGNRLGKMKHQLFLSMILDKSNTVKE